VALSSDTARRRPGGRSTLVREAPLRLSRSETSWSGGELSDRARRATIGLAGGALEGDTALIGGPGEHINGMGAAGAVFVYTAPERAGVSRPTETRPGDLRRLWLHGGARGHSCRRPRQTVNGV